MKNLADPKYCCVTEYLPGHLVHYALDYICIVSININSTGKRDYYIYPNTVYTRFFFHNITSICNMIINIPNIAVDTNLSAFTKTRMSMTYVT